jgi:hypothetical protein
MPGRACQGKLICCLYEANQSLALRGKIDLNKILANNKQMPPLVSLNQFKEMDVKLDEKLEWGYQIFVSQNPNVDQELITYLADWLWDNGVVMTI